MPETVKALLFVGIPFAAVMVSYYFVDKDGSLMHNVCSKWKFLITHKLLVQFLATIAFVALFGLLCMVLSLPVEVFYIVCGAYVGFINAAAAALMRKE